MLYSINGIKIDIVENEEIRGQNIELGVLRLDEIHPIVSGNKLFKLQFFIEEAKQTSHKAILTFGGIFSNHLVATAFSCMKSGLKSIGIVRGDKSEATSPTLLQCQDYGMKLIFETRENYKRISQNILENAELIEKYGEAVIIPEGGFSPIGVAGASSICKMEQLKSATHIIIPVGTATTLAGIIMGKNRFQKIIAVPAIKNMNDIDERLKHLGINHLANELDIFYDYHFGGFAKYNQELINFMNKFYAETSIPTDFVYTAKMMFGIFDKINKRYFPSGSNIVAIHTGGLQGNKSFAEGILNF